MWLQFKGFFQPQFQKDEHGFAISVPIGTEYSDESLINLNFEGASFNMRRFYRYLPPLLPENLNFMAKRNLFLYIGILYLVAWILQLSTIFTAFGRENRTFILAITMLTPACITLIFLKKHPAYQRFFLWRPNRQWFILSVLAITVPIILALSGIALLYFFNWGVSTWFVFSTKGVQILGGPWVLGIGGSSWSFFLLNIFLTSIVYVLLNSIVAAGEELGWRGFLQNVLIDQFGKTKGIILLGLVWSFWHLPVFLTGHNEPEYPVLGTFLLAPIRLVALSFFWGWLTLQCRSFIPAAFAHAALNSIQEGVYGHCQLFVPTIYKDLIMLVLTIVVGLLFYLFSTRQNAPY
jgi:uncharacterized protein